MFKRILVPLDGSNNAERVLPIAITEARLHGATLLLLRAIAPLRNSLMLIPSIADHVFEQIDEIAENYLEKVAGKIQSERIEVETMIKHGPPAQCIIEIAKDNECDLVIIGSHGETGALQWRFGSVANKVIKANLSIPIIIMTT